MTQEELIKNIKINAELYYTGQECVPDSVFDSWVQELSELAPTTDVLSSVGWGYSPASKKVKHLYNFEMYMDKIHPEDVLKFTRNSNITQCVITPKYDGASVFAYYTDGVFTLALTRGDGKVGQNITDKVKDLVPTYVESSFTGFVRGEFILPESAWKSKYWEEGKNSRNFSAGKLSSDVFEDCLYDHKVVCYFVYDVNNVGITAEEQLKFLRANNFTTTVYKKGALSDISNFNSTDYCTDVLSNLVNDEYQCDGIVITYDDEGRKVGVKWNIVTKHTTVTNVKWQNSRLGRFTPVLEIEPVILEGATISNVTGHNCENIVNNRIGKGAVVEISRSGGVIPKLERVISEGEVVIPERCPYCGSKLSMVGVNLVCENVTCSGRGENSVNYFIDTTVPVDGLGPTLISFLTSKFHITSVTDLITFANNKANSFKVIQECKRAKGLGESAAAKMLELLRKIREEELVLEKVIVGLGLPGLGEKTVKNISSSVTSLLEFITSIDESTKYMQGVTYVALTSLLEYKTYILSVVSAFIKTPVSYFKKYRENNIIKAYSNMKICVTGLLSVSRKDFLDECDIVGITESSIVKASVLVTNVTDNTVKYQEAQKRGIPVMTEAEFRKEYLA